MIQAHLDRRALLLLLFCCSFWGLQQVLIKATLPELPPLFQASLRFSGATLLLWLWCLGRGIALFERDGSLGSGTIVGLLFAAEFGLAFLGMEYTTASRLTVFLYTAPFWVALVLPFFIHDERQSALQWLGLLCAFAAVAWALRDGFVRPGPGVTPLGDMLGLAAGMLWGLTTVAIRITKMAKVSAEKLLFYQLLYASLTLPAVSLLLGEQWNWSWSGFTFFSMGLQILIGAFVSYLLWMWLIINYSATKVSVFLFLTPLVAVGAAAIFLRESISTGLLLALVMVMAGIALVNGRRH